MNKKVLVHLALLMFSFIPLFAQEDVKSIIDRVSNADYIFEGKVIFSQPYKSGDGKRIYTTNTIEITKIFKGDLHCGKVEVITNGGEVDGDICINSEYLTLKEGYTGIFLCGLNEKELSATDYIVENNLEKLTPIFEDQSYIRYYKEGLDFHISDVTFNFDSLAKVYDLTEVITQLTYVDCNNASTVLFNTNPQVHAIPYNPKPQVDISTVTKSQYATILNQKLQSPAHSHRSTTASGTITYTLSNPIITGTSPKYFEFDVNMGSDAGKYMTNAAVRFQYSTAAFGTNVYANGKVTVTRGTAVSDATQYPYILIDDLGSNIFGIGVSSDLSPTNLREYDPATEQLWHVRIELQNCNTVADVHFIHQDTMLMASYYEVTPSGTSLLDFASINATQSLSVPACKPTITSFTPNSIDAGVFQAFTIRGYQFGNNRGTVLFPNADDGGMSKTALNASDIFYWSDTVIKTLAFPSFCDTIQDSLGIVHNQGDSKPGTGKFIVVTDAGDKDTSATPLTVRYGVENYPIPTKIPFDLIKKDPNGGYQFYMDTFLWNNPDARACVIKAVADWKCLTGVSWEVVGSIIPSADTALLDGKNIIQLGYTGYSPLGTILGNTTTWGRNCGTKLYYPELDIVANASSNWFFDTTSTAPVPSGMKDFYAMILHELGHAHALIHVIDPNGVMHYQAQPTGPIPASSRKINIEYDAACAFGGNKVISLSHTVSYSCTGSPVAIVPQYLCTPFTAIKDVAHDMLSLNVYPNPFANDVTVTYSLDKDATMDMFVMDMQGHIVAQSEKKKYLPGEYKVELHLDNVASGQYLVWGHINGLGYYKTITCVH